MADPSYLDYARDPDDNQQGSASATRFPEGWPGKWINNGLAWMGSALRRLGDAVLLAPVDGNGNVVSRQARTMALQDATAVDATGGILATAVRGSVPVRTLIPWYGTLAQLNTALPQLLLGGWVPCDGRTVTNPYNQSPYVAPNLLGRLLGFPTALGSSPQNTGASSGTTTSSGSHAHSGSTTTEGAHTHSTTVSASTSNFDVPQGSGSTLGLAINVHSHTVAVASSGSHSHELSTSTGGAHTHTVDMDPLAVRVIPLIRAW